MWYRNILSISIDSAFYSCILKNEMFDESLHCLLGYYKVSKKENNTQILLQNKFFSELMDAAAINACNPAAHGWETPVPLSSLTSKTYPCRAHRLGAPDRDIYVCGG